MLLAGCALSLGALSPAVIRMERASRSLAATFIFEGLIQARDPLELFEDPGHQSFWFESGAKSLGAELEAAAQEKELALEDRPITPDVVKSASPLLAARARRAQKTKRVIPPTLRNGLPVPEGAVPEGPSEAEPDLRSGASRGLVRAKLEALTARRAVFESAIDEMLDPLTAPKLPAFDLAAMLLFLSEMESDDLPTSVACKEAGDLSVAYSGDMEQQSFRHVQGLLASYARERMGRPE